MCNNNNNNKDFRLNSLPWLLLNKILTCAEFRTAFSNSNFEICTDSNTSTPYGVSNQRLFRNMGWGPVLHHDSPTP